VPLAILYKKKRNQEEIDDLVKFNGKPNENEINELRTQVNKHEHDLSKFNADLVALRRQLNQKLANHSPEEPSWSKKLQ
ncbi:unnamed protein product, partial [Rotaria magnacalcarata]